MRASRFGALVIAMSAAVCGPASAQEGIRAGEWSRGTALGGFAGVAADGEHSGPAFGGVVGWEVTPRLTIEGSGAWFAFDDGAEAFAGSIRLRARLWGERKVDPFVVGGVGLYRASFDRTSAVAPAFYARRMAPGPGPGDLTFTDPSLVAGAGVNIFVSRHFALRPDVETQIVMRDRRTHLVTSVAMHVVFHIESHPVTPRVR